VVLVKNTLVYFMLGIILLTVNQQAIARDETIGKVYHFIFKLQKDISGSENQAIMNGFKMKMDTLGIIRYSMQRDRDLFIITVKAHINPETIAAEIQADKITFPLTLVTYFVCDATENREQFFHEGY
jgi:hypothetical protein